MNLMELTVCWWVMGGTLGSSCTVTKCHTNPSFFANPAFFVTWAVTKPSCTEMWHDWKSADSNESHRIHESASKNFTFRDSFENLNSFVIASLQGYYAIPNVLIHLVIHICCRIYPFLIHTFIGSMEFSPEVVVIDESDQFNHMIMADWANYDAQAVFLLVLRCLLLRSWRRRFHKFNAVMKCLRIGGREEAETWRKEWKNMSPTIWSDQKSEVLWASWSEVK